MKNDVSGIIAELEDIESAVRTDLAPLSVEQLNWRPSPDAWSAGQCLDHVIRSNESFFGEFDKLAAGTRTNSFWETWSPLSSLAGNFLVKSLKADDKKVKTISKMTPPSEIDGAIVDIFLGHQTILAGKIRAVENTDWEKTVVTSPFLGLMTYRLSAGLQAIIEHEKRHIRQAVRVTEAEGFPR
ncbi:MAG TPA: DinB family protein [Pyrinomonadaceae bacterium]|nr:DinB family protein [Pyrinomonadaceae bacterium]